MVYAVRARIPNHIMCFGEKNWMAEQKVMMNKNISIVSIRFFASRLHVMDESEWNYTAGEGRCVLREKVRVDYMKDRYSGLLCLFVGSPKLSVGWAEVWTEGWRIAACFTLEDAHNYSFDEGEICVTSDRLSIASPEHPNSKCSNFVRDIRSKQSYPNSFGMRKYRNWKEHAMSRLGNLWMKLFSSLVAWKTICHGWGRDGRSPDSHFAKLRSPEPSHYWMKWIDLAQMLITLELSSFGAIASNRSAGRALVEYTPWTSTGGTCSADSMHEIMLLLYNICGNSLPLGAFCRSHLWKMLNRSAAAGVDINKIEIAHAPSHFRRCWIFHKLTCPSLQSQCIHLFIHSHSAWRRTHTDTHTHTTLIILSRKCRMREWKTDRKKMRTLRAHKRRVHYAQIAYKHKLRLCVLRDRDEFPHLD